MPAYFFYYFPESHKRKPKNWEENDFYDSDEDTFLDRTGIIEKKREMRMKAKAAPKAETYESLVSFFIFIYFMLVEFCFFFWLKQLEKENNISSSIKDLELQLSQVQQVNQTKDTSDSNIDPLDSYMLELKQDKPDKQKINKLKRDLHNLKQEHVNVVKLLNIAKPAALPSLVVPDYHTASTSSTNLSGSKPKMPIFGKIKKIKLDLTESNKSGVNSPENMEVDNEEDLVVETDETEENDEEQQDEEYNEEVQYENEEMVPIEDLEEAKSSTKMTMKEFEKILKKNTLPPLGAKYQTQLSKILRGLKKIASTGDRLYVDWKIMEAKRKKIMKLIENLPADSEPDEKIKFKITTELDRILNEVTNLTEEKSQTVSKMSQMGIELRNISDAAVKDLQEQWKKEDLEEKQEQKLNAPSTSKELDRETDDRRKKKNQRRIQQKQEKAEIEKQKGYEEDAQKEDYNMWVPPDDQSGDGRTQLNEKFGY